MKMIFVNYVCFLLLFSYVWNSCEDVTPTKASDCVLSQEDKNNGYTYCCYEKVSSLKVCTLDTEETYQQEKELIEGLGIEYECNVKGENNKSCYMNLPIIFALLYIILSL